MIKVIATDMDGTLLDDKHSISDINVKALKKAQKKGMKIIIATGRNYHDAFRCMKNYDIKCDYLVSSGAELRNEKSEVIKRIPMDTSYFQDIISCAEKYSVAVKFSSADCHYMFGNEKELYNYVLKETGLFYEKGTEEEIANSEIFRWKLKKLVSVKTLDDLLKETEFIYKIFICDKDIEKIKLINKELSIIPNIVSASTSKENIELTHVKAQKGIVLKKYIEKLGYNMGEVMVLGDSMNDFSMLSMDFGITVAMDNADKEIKNVSKYVTLSNTEHGVAFALRKLMDDKIEDLLIKQC
jgi:Cof subfamily protein (haloacid dehalogenase superfamily)